MGKSHRDPVRKGKAGVLGEVPPVKKEWKTRFKKGQTVYMTAFLKEEKGIFYAKNALNMHDKQHIENKQVEKFDFDV